MTVYVVLSKDESGHWSEIGAAQAANDKAAIKACASTSESGTYVAVPERSWTPRTLTIDPNPTVKFGVG